MGEGRFGPLFHATDPDGLRVVVRSFAQPFSDVQRNRFVAALQSLCERPLEHPSIARPLGCGVQGGRPYVVHAYFPGEPLDEFVARHGRPSLADIILRLTYLGGALDFAEAAGVLHGSLTTRDVIFSDDNAGVSGLGLVQALEKAGIPAAHASREDDLAAFVGIARELLGPAVAPRLASVLAAPLPDTALSFAAALNATLEAPPITAPASAPPAVEPQAAPEPQGRLFPLPDPAELFVSERALVDAAGDAIARPVALNSEFDIPLRETPRGDVDVPARADVEPDSDFVPVPDSPVVATRPMFGAAETGAAYQPVVPTRRGSWKWVLGLAVALALGIFAGFAGGFFVAHDTGDSRSTPAASHAASPSEPAPADTAQTYTDAPVDAGSPAAASSPQQTAAAPQTSTAAPPKTSAPPVQASATPAPPAAVSPPPVPGRSGRPVESPGPAQRGARQQPPAPPPSGPAAVRVDSLPAGAQVFVDGRSVGYTPLVVGDLTPGTHSIRIQLSGYRPWVTAVTLGPGARERLSASLEQ